MIIVEGTYQDASHLGLINLRIDRFEATDFVPNGVVFLRAIGYAVQASDETQTEIEVEITIPDLFYEDTWDDQVVRAHIISHIQSLGFNAYEQTTPVSRMMRVTGNVVDNITPPVVKKATFKLGKMLQLLWKKLISLFHGVKH